MLIQENISRFQSHFSFLPMSENMLTEMLASALILYIDSTKRLISHVVLTDLCSDTEGGFFGSKIMFDFSRLLY